MKLKGFKQAKTGNPFYLNVDFIEYICRDIERPNERTRIWIHGEKQEYLVEGKLEDIVNHIRI